MGGGAGNTLTHTHTYLLRGALGHTLKTIRRGVFSVLRQQLSLIACMRFEKLCTHAEGSEKDRQMNIQTDKHMSLRRRSNGNKPKRELRQRRAGNYTQRKRHRQGTKREKDTIKTCGAEFSLAHSCCLASCPSWFSRRRKVLTAFICSLRFCRSLQTSP